MTIVLRVHDGPSHPLPTSYWLAQATAAEMALLHILRGPVLDVGCGPGRLLVALGQLGVPALGVDTSAHAVRHARQAGAAVLHRSAFDPIPGQGQWPTVLLIDGNIGIGGDPAGILSRAAELVSADGQVVVEVDPPGSSVGSAHARLERDDDVVSEWFPWAWVDASGLDFQAARAGLRRIRWHVADGRWFALLCKTSRVGSAPRSSSSDEGDPMSWTDRP